jgi:DNA sulfur modification protein DndD
MGCKIKDCIERILGVPVLTNARSNMKRLLDEAQKAESKAAQKNQQTQEFGNHHALLIEQRTSHEAELERLKNDLVTAKSRKRTLRLRGVEPG